MRRSLFWSFVGVALIVALFVRVLGAAAGSKHVAVLTQNPSSSWAALFPPPGQGAAEDRFVDCILAVDSDDGVLTYPAHKALLSSRSPYLRGFLKSAESALANEGAEGEGSAGCPSVPSATVVSISSENATSATMKELLSFIYTDSIAALSEPKTRAQLLRLGQELGLQALVQRLQVSGSYIQRSGGCSSASTPALVSTYAQDLEQLLRSGRHADLVFVASPSLLDGQTFEDGIPSAVADAQALMDEDNCEQVWSVQFRQLC